MNPFDMDKEVVALCKAMNLVEGIQTVESCCGHGKEPFKIWFDAENLECLPGLLYWFDGCHSDCYNWQVVVYTDCAMSPVIFKVTGPVGAYSDAEQIAKCITRWANNESI